MALVLLGSMLIPSVETMCPKNTTSLAKNSHFVSFAVRLLVCRILSTVSMCCRWVLWSAEWIRMSSMKTLTKSRLPRMRLTKR
eukprot:1384302-Rhodomonas_salina.1